MGFMTHKTKGIVLRAIKYGETSLVVTIFTELFGVQTYMVNGVRSSKKSPSKAGYFQPASILELVVYHNEQKSMQRIREFSWDYLYQQVLSDVIKNSIALFMVELLKKCLKQPEQNTALFYFCEDVLKQLDMADKTVTANIALFFTLHLTHFLGFKMNNDYDANNNILDLNEGNFVEMVPAHAHIMEGEQALLTSHLLKVMHPDELCGLKLNKDIRSKLLSAYLDYYALHLQDFGTLKTLSVLQEILA